MTLGSEHRCVQKHHLLEPINVLKWWSSSQCNIAHFCSVFDAIELFMRELKKFVLMTESAPKCENIAIFKKHYTLKLYIASKRGSSCCFRLEGNLYFLVFVKKVF